MSNAINNNPAYSQKLKKLIPILESKGQIAEPHLSLNSYIKWLNHIFFYDVFLCEKDSTITTGNKNLRNIKGSELIIKEKITFNKDLFYPAIFKKSPYYEMNFIRSNFENNKIAIIFQPYLYEPIHILSPNGFQSEKDALNYIETWKYKNHDDAFLEAHKNYSLRDSLFLITSLDKKSKYR